jgi:FecR protein
MTKPNFARHAAPLLGTAVLVALLSLLPATHALAARVTALQGFVQILRGERLLPAVVGSRLRVGDEFVSEGADSEALVRFDDGARMALRADSRLQVTALKLKGPVEARQKTIKILKGGLRYISGRRTLKSTVAFQTATATIGIRGTDIEIAVSEDPVNNDPAGTYLKVNSGIANMEATDGTQVDVDAGQIAFGGLPEVVPRGPGGTRRPAARKVEAAVGAVGGLFKSGALDRLLR